MNSISHYIGPDFLLRARKAAILNSRQSKYPIGNDTWVKATGRAVEYCRNNGLVILTSIGMNTWELVLTYASRLKAEILLILHPPVDDNHLYPAELEWRFHLDRSKVGFMLLDPYRQAGRKKQWSVRDYRIAYIADKLIPVSVRKGGNLDLLIGQFGNKVIDNFSVSYENRSRSRPVYDSQKISDEIRKLDLIAHFTRSSNSPWPGETGYDYYLSVINSEDRYCRSAIDGLLNILKQKAIRGSSKNIRGGFSVVGFTSLNPGNKRNLFRYRPRLVNPGFEPYGIALKKHDAPILGIEPVSYGQPDLYHSMHSRRKPFYQHEGSYGSQWRLENEWRHEGDFYFGHLPEDYLKILVPTTKDIDMVSQYTTIPILSIF